MTIEEVTSTYTTSQKNMSKLNCENNSLNHVQQQLNFR